MRYSTARGSPVPVRNRAGNSWRIGYFDPNGPIPLTCISTAQVVLIIVLNQLCPTVRSARHYLVSFFFFFFFSDLLFSPVGPC